MDFTVGAKNILLDNATVSDVISYSPDCFVRFFRFVNRDTLEENIMTLGKIADTGTFVDHNRNFNGRYMNTEIVDANQDVISCTVSKAKAQAAGTFEVTLAPGHVNYFNTLHPGDQVLIWMRRQTITKQDLNNSYTSGLKMYGVVEGVRKQFVTAANGIKTLRYVISGVDFGYFFNTEIYYNPILADEALNDQFGVMYKELGVSLGGLFTFDLFSPSGNLNILLNAFIGTSKGRTNLGIRGAETTPNSVFKVPNDIYKFFVGGQPRDGSPSVSDILNRRFGVLQYRKDVFGPIDALPLNGIKFIKIDPGNEYTLWSILNDYANRTMNEMFLELKPARDGRLLPTIILREYPWTTTKEVENVTGLRNTLFTELPKFRLPEEYVFVENTGKSNKVRYNYIQMFGFGSVEIGDPRLHDFQTFLGNFAIDRKSISRHGLSVLKVDTDYDLNTKSLNNTQQTLINIAFNDPTGVKRQFSSIEGIAEEAEFSFGGTLEEEIKNSQSLKEEAEQIRKVDLTLISQWTKIYADWFLNAHLWVNGTWQTVGIEEPISLGMNMEIQRTDKTRELHHVESYTHSFSVDANGLKTFRTNFATVRGRRSDGQPLHVGLLTSDFNDNIGITSNVEKRSADLQIVHGEIENLPAQFGEEGEVV